ncbi:unnamed protein product [Rangifer tarandus platyrhynchus]|uniref:Secreted protein n=2 Tax=Rangifer tarandus platyrhynchus TaxID=3082113 RepID=A0ABN8YW56_RANTA|nr:unnamed protein product [Rangifer tarandus platyrhynchus]
MMQLEFSKFFFASVMGTGMTLHASLSGSWSCLNLQAVRLQERGAYQPPTPERMVIDKKHSRATLQGRQPGPRPGSWGFLPRTETPREQEQQEDLSCPDKRQKPRVPHCQSQGDLPDSTHTASLLGG